MRVIERFKQLHKWLALLIVIQLLLWIISGLVFSFIDHKKVSGNFLINKNRENEFNQPINFNKVISVYPDAIEITQRNLLRRTVFQVKSNDVVILVDGSSVKEIKLKREQIKQIANEYYQGGGKITQLELMTKSTDESRNIELPSWQVVFSDQTNSHLYFSAITGEFQAIRTDSWRIFDFFMMLHFMDYAERGNFNHLFIISFSLIFMFLSTSGMLLVVGHFSKQDWFWLVSFISSGKKLSITVQHLDGKITKIRTKGDHRLIDILSTEKIILSSTCGGGGICGKCKVKVIARDGEKLKAYTQENTVKQLVSDDEVNQGYRLACQFYVDKDVSIEIPVLI